MFESIKEWMNVPVIVKPFERRTGSGDKIFGDAYELLTYPVSEVQVVRNSHGVDVSSSQQLYIDGASSIKEMDNITFEDTERPVQAIRSFYRNGVPDIKVVFL